MSNAKKTSEEMARYVAMGQPLPEELAKRLIDELCDEYKEEQKMSPVKRRADHMV
jgi:hypothetical protein